MNKLEKEMPSIKKLQDEIKSMKWIGLLGGKELKNSIKKSEEKFNICIEQINLFNTNFSDNGWIAYDILNFKLIQKVNIIFEKNGLDEAEKELIKYYTTEIENGLYILKMNSEELAIRYDLILKAYEDHKLKRYHASIPLFLMIIDGAVNDFTKNKSFFAQDTDVSSWDCLVGCSNGLEKLKKIYNKSRKKTNIERIELPYRNGILHGRDLNYANVEVSCKCLVLLFAIHDWMANKKSEEIRKNKLQKDKEVSTWEELGERLKKNKEERIKLDEWKPQKIIVGKNIPERGEIEEYNNYDYIKEIIKMFEYWKKGNYGNLSKILKELFKFEKSEKIRPKLCRNLFTDKVLVSYRLLEVEERGMLSRRVLVEVSWKTKEKLITEKLEFGLICQSKDKNIVIPDNKDIEWIIMPWKVQALYKI